MKANAPEKLYISDYGSEVRYYWHPKRLAVKDIEYTRTDAFIEKACAWLEENADMFEAFDSETKTYYMDENAMIEQFKKAMRL